MRLGTFQSCFIFGCRTVLFGGPGGLSRENRTTRSCFGALGASETRIILHGALIGCRSLSGLIHLSCCSYWSSPLIGSHKPDMTSSVADGSTVYNLEFMGRVLYSINIGRHRHHHTTVFRHGHGRLVLTHPIPLILPSRQRSFVECSGLHCILL